MVVSSHLKRIEWILRAFDKEHNPDGKLQLTVENAVNRY